MASKILITAERWQLVALLEKALQRQGWETIIAKSQHEIIPLINREPIALAILELDLLGKDYLHVLRDMRHYQRQIPVLLISKFDELGDRATRFMNGMAEALPNPFKVNELTERVNAWCGH
ncbi:MAG: hypothetical protein Kow00121_29740 [Elainellaceae cyanobacterium]